MQPREYDIMYGLETSYWWHTGMAAIMEQILAPTLTPGSRLLDVGCGTGAKLQLLNRYCETWGIDINPRAVELSKARGLKNIYSGDATNLPFAKEQFSHLICCEVLQNLPDDWSAVSQAFRVLKPGGYYYISEQAYPVLRGEHDISQEALRRYTRGRIKQLLDDNGFQIRRISSANTILFPLLASWRLASRLLKPPEKITPEDSHSDLKPLPRPANQLLRSLLDLERLMLKKSDLPFGLTIIVLAQKP